MRHCFCIRKIIKPIVYFLHDRIQSVGIGYRLYDIVISVVGMYGAGPQREGEKNDDDYDCRCVVMQVPPGLWGLWIPTHGSGMGVMTALEISFRNARGKCWIRRRNGDLIAIDRNPLQYFSIPLPPQWSTVERVLAKAD